MRTLSCCAASWNLAGLQDEVRGLSEPVQRLASENETLRSQTTVGAVRTVTMANEVARLNKPTAFSRAEEEYSDWEFALTCFVGTMDGTFLTVLRAVAANPRVNRVPTDEAGNERARALCNILALLTTKGPRKMVREVPDQNGYEVYRSFVLRYGSRDAHGETALLIKVMNFNFGDIDAMETKFEEFNFADQRARRHYRCRQHTRHDQASRSCGKSARTTANPLAVEQKVIHNLPQDASGNQSVPESTQKFQTHGAR